MVHHQHMHLSLLTDEATLNPQRNNFETPRRAPAVNESPYDTQRFDYYAKRGISASPNTVRNITQRNPFESAPPSPEKDFDDSDDEGGDPVRDTLLAIAYMESIYPRNSDSVTSSPVSDISDDADLFLTSPTDSSPVTPSDDGECYHDPNETVKFEYKYPTHTVTRTIIRPRKQPVINRIASSLSSIFCPTPTKPNSSPVSPFSRPSSPVLRSESPLMRSNTPVTRSTSPVAGTLRMLQNLCMAGDAEEERFDLAHQWFLEQAGWARMEVWVETEVKTYIEEDEELLNGRRRPRVFFPPPPGSRMM